MKTSRLFLFLPFVVLASGCEKYLGDKTDLGFIEPPVYSPREIAYVPIQPALTNFVRPVDVCAGFDELIYVVDEGSQEIICLDQAGREQSRYYLQGVTSVTQDRRFNLLAIGTKTTEVNGVIYDLTCLYRLDLLNDDGRYGLQYAEIEKEIVHPFYFKTTFSSTDAQVKFNKVAVVGDDFNPAQNNWYYVTRTGPSPNNAGQGPDDAVLLFNNQDQLVSRVSVTTSSGLFNDYFELPFGLTTRCQPPQLTASNLRDFIFSSLDPNGQLKVQYIEFIETEFGSEYRPRILNPGDTTQADRFLNQPGRFRQPKAVTYTGDGTNYIFVADAETDSVYQFTVTGLEGIQPPPGAGSTKYQRASFGGTGLGLTQFNEPSGLAYLDKILYVADAGNGRLLRFKLTLDFD